MYVHSEPPRMAVVPRRSEFELANSLLSSGGFEKATAPDIFKAVAFLSVENFIKNFPQFILKRKANTLDKYIKIAE